MLFSLRLLSIRIQLSSPECDCLPDRLSRRALIDLRAGRSRPHRKNREIITMALRKLGLL